MTCGGAGSTGSFASQQALLDFVDARRSERTLELLAADFGAATLKRRVTLGLGSSLELDPDALGRGRFWTIRGDEQFDVAIEQALALGLRWRLLAGANQPTCNAHVQPTAHVLRGSS